MSAPDKIYLPVVEEEGKRLLCTIWWPEDNRLSNEKFVVDAIPYIRKDALLDWVKLAYGKVSMNPFDCSEAFEELINKIESL